MFRRKRGFLKSDSLYIIFIAGDTYQMIIFDIINSFSNVGSGSNFATSILLFIISCSRLLSNKVISDRFMATEEIIFRWLSLISWIVYKNFGSGSNFDTSMLLFILSCLKFSPNKVIADRFMAAEAILSDDYTCSC